MTFKKVLQTRAKKTTQTKVLEKFGPHNIILAPLFTEKTYKQQENINTYTFKVHASATKSDVKQAIVMLYKITPLSVNVVNVPFKGRTQRPLTRRAYKKAIIKLNKKDKIEVTA